MKKKGQNIKDYLFGKDYTQKLSEFDSIVSEIEKEYKEDFDTETNYYSIETRGSEVKIVFDEDKDIPKALEQNITNTFNRIWK